MVGNISYSVNDIAELDMEQKIAIVVDRLSRKDYSDNSSPDTKRLKDSINLAYKIGSGLMNILEMDQSSYGFSQIFICSSCGHIPQELTISSFSFNSHSGACQECHGLGIKKVFLEEKVTNPKLTLLEGAVIAPGFGGDYFFALLAEIGKHNTINLNINYSLLSSKEKELVLYGTGKKQYSVTYTNEQGIQNTYQTRFEGVIHALTRRYYDGGSEKGNYDDYVIDMDCHLCDGHRLNRESLGVYVGDINIGELADKSVSEALVFLQEVSLSKTQQKIIAKVRKNAIERLEFLE